MVGTFFSMKFTVEVWKDDDIRDRTILLLFEFAISKRPNRSWLGFTANYFSNMRSETNGYVVKRIFRFTPLKICCRLGVEIQTERMSAAHGEGDKVSKSWVLVCYSLISDS